MKGSILLLFTGIQLTRQLRPAINPNKSGVKHPLSTQIKHPAAATFPPVTKNLIILILKYFLNPKLPQAAADHAMQFWNFSPD